MSSEIIRIFNKICVTPAKQHVTDRRTDRYTVNVILKWRFASIALQEVFQQIYDTPKMKQEGETFGTKNKTRD